MKKSIWSEKRKQEIRSSFEGWLQEITIPYNQIRFDWHEEEEPRDDGSTTHFSVKSGYPYLYITNPKESDNYLIIIRPISKKIMTFDKLLGTQGVLKDKSKNGTIGDYDAIYFTENITYEGEQQPTTGRTFFLENSDRVFEIIHVPFLVTVVRSNRFRHNWIDRCRGQPFS